MSEFSCTMRLVRETTGALLYGEVNPANGQTFSAPNAPGAKVGNQYLRKTAFNGSGWPQEVTLTISYDK